MSAEKTPVEHDAEERRRLQIEKNQAAIRLLRSWNAEPPDDSDEEVWQQLKPLLESSHSPERRLFYDE